MIVIKDWSPKLLKRWPNRENFITNYSEDMQPIVEQQPDVIPEKRWKTQGEEYRYKEDEQYVIPAKEINLQRK